MSLTNPIHYTIFDQVIPENRLPHVAITSDSMAYGTITLQIPLTSCTVTAAMYRLAPPTTTEDRWSRLQPELLVTYPLAVSYSSIVQSDGYYKITWKFDPTVIPSVVTGQWFGIEFFVNATHTASVAQFAPKVIVEISNEIDTTGVTGYAGITGLDSVYQGMTGAQGWTGFGGATGLQGAVGQTGSQGFTGAQGLKGDTGLQGAQGDTGAQGLTGMEGYGGVTGAPGLTGAAGVTGTGMTGAQGIQGETGENGITGSVGEQGPTGVIGITGQQGAPGLGATGIQGETGFALGVTGLIGTTGLMNFVESATYTSPSLQPAVMWQLNDLGLFAFVTGIGYYVQVSAGAQVGGTGLQGYTGAQAVTGAQGWTGAQGFTGAQGYTGVWGHTGSQGQTGAQAVTGAQGWTGAQGITGFQGITGVQGFTGTPGFTGAQGFTGTIGATGIIGITIDSINGLNENPINKTYCLDSKTPGPYTINSLSIIDVSGTCIADIMKNGVGVSGLYGLAVSSVRNNATATGNNSVIAGDRIVMVIRSANLAVDVEWTLGITR